MYDLHAMSSPNALRIVLMLEETAAPYRLHHVDVWRGEQHGEAFRRLNPNGKVPVLVDSEGPGGSQTLFESGAILLYLAEKSGFGLPREGAARYEVLQWMTVVITGIGPMFGQYVHFTRFMPEGHDYSRARYTNEARRLLALIEDRLAQAPYLGGADYSIADIAAFPWLNRLEPIGLATQERPHLADWLGRLRARPAVERTLARIAEIQPKDLANREAASPDDLDRMFGRGRYAMAG